MRRRGRYGLGLSLAFWLLSGLSFLLADQLWPLPDPQRMHSIVIEAEDGTPLRAFADEKGIWRYPITLAEVSPLYIQALLQYEDRWFYYHPGVNPFALLRAAWQWLSAGQVVSGGSTLTMQMARILDPHERSVWGKSCQVFRALQLEWHYTKDEILTFYLNLAPFGGALEGVQTASMAWLHKPATQLSYAEAALLTIIPQLPSRLRPDRYPLKAQQYRDKVLRRLLALTIWPKQAVQEALQEPVIPAHLQQPQLAPLLAERMRTIAQRTQQARLLTTLNATLQGAVEQVVRGRLVTLSTASSLGILVMENATGYVRAYVGSADYANAERDGYVDTVQAIRSPGSTLKPFLYGFALDDGLIHSASLLSDVPLQVQDYAPKNFFRQFSGPVTAAEALQHSLNIPAVDLTQRVGSATVADRLRHGGIALVFPANTPANVSMILGGVGTSLEDLVHGYSSLARQGVSIKPRFLPSDAKLERCLLSPGAAWVIKILLQEVSPPEGMTNNQQIAWKTGTSYGFRDAWAIGVNERYTVGVWTGRPDATPLPGRFGAYAAGPILFEVFRVLPRSPATLVGNKPASVSQTTICWPLGQRVEDTPPEACQEQKTAWIVEGKVPPTLPNLQQPSWSASLQTVWLNPTTGLRVTPECTSSERVAKLMAQWPVALNAWLAPSILARMQLPALDPSCPAQIQQTANKALVIQHLTPNTRLVLPSKANINSALDNKGVTIALMAEGGQGYYLWLVNGEIVGKDDGHAGLRYTFSQAGDYVITVIDAAGAAAKVTVQVVANPNGS